MINDLKLGFKIMKYGHSAKLSIIGSIVLAMLGLVICIISITAKISFPGGYFLTMSVLLLLQLISTVNAANLVQTSPMKKKLQTSVPAFFSILMMLAAYLLNVVVVAVVVCANPEEEVHFYTQIIYTAALMGMIMLYYGAVYKYFVVSTIVFFTIFMFVYPSIISGDISEKLYWSFMPFAEPWQNFTLTAVIGLAFILVCGVLQYLISLAVYKAPISKLALGARLRSQM